MEHHNTIFGRILVTISAFGAYISMREYVINAQPYVTFFAGVISMTAGCFAIRYYIKKSK